QWIIQAYDPRHAVALLDGPTAVSGRGFSEIRHQREMASVRMSGDDNWQTSIEFPKMVVQYRVDAGRLLAHAQATGNGSIDLALSAENLNISLADGSALPLDSLEIEATLPKDAVVENVARYLAKERKEIAITAVAARQGELAVRGSGTVGVDIEGYLTGRIATHINRINLLLALVKRLVHLSDNDAAAAKTLIGLLQKGDGDTVLDLIAKDHKLYWGPFKLTKLEPLF